MLWAEIFSVAMTKRPLQSDSSSAVTSVFVPNGTTGRPEAGEHHFKVLQKSAENRAVSLIRSQIIEEPLKCPVQDWESKLGISIASRRLTQGLCVQWPVSRIGAIRRFEEKEADWGRTWDGQNWRCKMLNCQRNQSDNFPRHFAPNQIMLAR